MTDHELLQALYNDMQGMKSDIHDMKGDIQNLKNDTQGMKGDIQTLKADMQTVKQKVSNIELRIENVTDKNIQIIAEGHLRLNQKLNEALRSEKEKEMLMIRVNILEGELQKLKNSSTQIA